MINPKIAYSKDSMRTFLNGKNAHDAGAYTTAFKLLIPLARLGHRRAQTGVGLMYLYGHGLPKDEKMAIEWFESAVRIGKDESHHN